MEYGCSGAQAKAKGATAADVRLGADGTETGSVSGSPRLFTYEDVTQVSRSVRSALHVGSNAVVLCAKARRGKGSSRTMLYSQASTNHFAEAKVFDMVDNEQRKGYTDMTDKDFGRYGHPLKKTITTIKV